jgi:hypothetical protein
MESPESDVTNPMPLICANPRASMTLLIEGWLPAFRPALDSRADVAKGMRDATFT